MTNRPPHLSHRASHACSYGGGVPTAVHVGTRRGVVGNRGCAPLDSDRTRHDCDGLDRQWVVRRTDSACHPTSDFVHRNHRRLSATHRGDGIAAGVPRRVVRVCPVGADYGPSRGPTIDSLLAPARPLRARDTSHVVPRSEAISATDRTLHRPSRHRGGRRRRAVVRDHRRVRASGRTSGTSRRGSTRFTSPSSPPARSGTGAFNRLRPSLGRSA